MLGRVEELSSSNATQPDNVVDQRPSLLRGNSNTEAAPNWNGYIMYGATVVSSFMFTLVKYMERLTFLLIFCCNNSYEK